MHHFLPHHRSMHDKCDAVLPWRIAQCANTTHFNIYAKNLAMTVCSECSLIAHSICRRFAPIFCAPACTMHLTRWAYSVGYGDSSVGYGAGLGTLEKGVRIQSLLQHLSVLQSISQLGITYMVSKGRFLSLRAYMVWDNSESH